MRSLTAHIRFELFNGSPYYRAIDRLIGRCCNPARRRSRSASPPALPSLAPPTARRTPMAEAAIVGDIIRFPPLPPPLTNQTLTSTPSPTATTPINPPLAPTLASVTVIDLLYFGVGDDTSRRIEGSLGGLGLARSHANVVAWARGSIFIV
jgi:hypothetical protein